METDIGQEDMLDRKRQMHNEQMRAKLAELASNAMLELARSHGKLVVTPQLAQMIGQFSAVAATAIMGEMAVIQSRLTIEPEDVPIEHRNGTTQDIIDNFVSGRMAESMARAAFSAGLVRPHLAIPPAGAVRVTFAAWGHLMRPAEGPVAMPNAPRLDYGQGVTVFPRATGLAWPLAQLPERFKP